MTMSANVVLNVESSFLSGLFTGQSPVRVLAKPQSDRAPSEIVLAPHSYGQIVVHNLKKMQNCTLHIMHHCYLASSGAVNISINSSPTLSGAIFGGGLFMMAASVAPNTPDSESNVAIHGGGHITEHIITPNSCLKVEACHVVAWEDTVAHQMVTATKSFFSSAFSGEGVMFQFTGNGSVYTQSRRSIRSIVGDMCSK